ncbi:MAG TPA: ankyrin repeat domain-containing protein [Rhodothermales bacterium]|nr:ankyrin repeat domain-containing protein [Rhodothermales bacterium]
MRAFLYLAHLALLFFVGAAHAQTPDVYEAASAARDRDAETVQHVLDAGGDVNACTGDGATLLIWAADGGHTDLIRMLLDAEADPDLMDQAVPPCSTPPMANTPTSFVCCWQPRLTLRTRRRHGGSSRMLSYASTDG